MKEVLRVTSLFFANIPLDSGPIRKLLELAENLKELKFGSLKELDEIRLQSLQILENNWTGFTERCS